MRMCRGLMWEFKVKARLDQTLMLKMKATLDQTLMNKLKARLDQTLVILEEPASSSGTLSSLQHLTKDLSFGDLFFNDKASKADNDKATAKIVAESMVSVTIQQDTSLIPPMITPIINLTSRPESPKVHQLLKATAIETTTTTTTTTIHPPLSQPQQSTTDSMLMKRIVGAEVGQSWGTYVHIGASRHTTPVPPSPPPPPSTNQEGQSKGSASPSSSKTAASAEYQAWTTTDTRLMPSVSLTPADLQMDDDMAPDVQA
nr:hypothetical protein [Tanacetum cinerariifolium]